MVRTSLAAAALAVLATAAGCTMCCHPYDYCGPIYDGPYATGCQHNLRMNSIFSGTAQMPPKTPTAHDKKAAPSTPAATSGSQPESQTDSMSEPQLVPQPMAEPTSQYAPQSSSYGDVAGSERIISVTERTVEPPALVDNSVAQSNGTTERADATERAATPVSSQGWIARRTTGDTILR